MTERYLVIGLAKTGTTVISKTIQNSRGLPNYHLEPKKISFFETLPEEREGCVVKIIFDHWNDRRRLLNAIIHNDLETNFAANIFITRDPRAEMVSRIHYVAYPYFLANQGSDKDAADWLALFQRKETDPSFSLRDLVEALRDRFEVRMTDGAASISQQYAKYVGNLSSDLKVLVRYEDFLQSKLENHPFAHLFIGSRDVGADLQRTRRSGEGDDWRAYLTPSDLEWMNDILAVSLDKLDYGRDVDTGGQIDPRNCSRYVARLIEEARATHQPAAVPLS